MPAEQELQPTVETVQTDAEVSTTIPVRIDDPEKARVMADAEALHRDEAILERELSHPTDSDDITNQREAWAKEHEELAESAGEEAGRQHDAEQTRIQDSKKAYEMANAGNTFRSIAATNRDEANRVSSSPEEGMTETQLANRAEHVQGLMTAADAHDESADRQEKLAGWQYDSKGSANQGSPQEAAYEPYPHRVQDPAKAHEMAKAGDWFRGEASIFREYAKDLRGQGEYDKAKGYSDDARRRDQLAESEEHLAAEQYERAEYQKMLDEITAAKTQLESLEHRVKAKISNHQNSESLNT